MLLPMPHAGSAPATRKIRGGFSGQHGSRRGWSRPCPMLAPAFQGSTTSLFVHRNGGGCHWPNPPMPTPLRGAGAGGLHEVRWAKRIGPSPWIQTPAQDGLLLPPQAVRRRKTLRCPLQPPVADSLLLTRVSIMVGYKQAECRGGEERRVEREVGC